MKFKLQTPKKNNAYIIDTYKKSKISRTFQMFVNGIIE